MQTHGQEKLPFHIFYSHRKTGSDQISKSQGFRSQLSKDDASAAGKKRKAAPKKKGKGRKRASPPVNNDSNSDGYIKCK